jgi:hypothetical protein
MKMANKRLIDAEAVRHKINAFAASVVYRGSDLMFTGKDSCNPHEYTRGYEQGVLDAQKIVCGQDPVDAVEVVHGRWIEKIDMVESYLTDSTEVFYECSVCECGNIGESPYCPNCGADMRGETE